MSLLTMAKTFATFLMLLFFSTYAVSSTTDEERETLVTLYNSLGGPLWESSDKDFSTWTVGDPCDNNWEGISCSGSDRITRIILADCNLSGSIPPTDMWNLPELKVL